MLGSSVHTNMSLFSKFTDDYLFWKLSLLALFPPKMLNYVTVINRAIFGNWILQEFPRLLQFTYIFKGNMCEKIDILLF